MVQNKINIQVSRPDLTSLEKKYLIEAFDSTWISSKGKFINEVEEILTNEVQQKYALVTSSGTTALHLAILALDLSPGDEVIVPSLTYVASVNSIIYAGLKPVFADIDYSTFNLTLKTIEKCISKKTRAILLVHLYGSPADLLEIKKFCIERKIFLIEDVAEGIFSKNKNIISGSVGNISTFSFFGNKILTSGEGGAVVTSNLKFYQKMKMLREQGMDQKRRYWFPVVGYNYRMTNLSAAILKAQFERKTEILRKRYELYSIYNQIVSKYKNFCTQVDNPGIKYSPWIYPLLFNSKKVNQKKLMAEFSKKNIETRPFFIPIHLMPPYKKFSLNATLPVTIKLSKSGINIPTASNFSKQEIEYIKKNLDSILSKFNENCS